MRTVKSSAFLKRFVQPFSSLLHDIKAINKTIPFAPKIRMEFDPLDTLTVYRNFKTEELYFKAKLRDKYDFFGEIDWL